MALSNTFLLLAEALLYFAVMAALFRARRRIGIGLFVCALGVMHFLETYLASVFYIELPFGIISPGSTVLFSGKLVMILLLYMREDAAAVRQPIYGLIIGNLLIVGLVLILRLHHVVPPVPGRLPDIGFIDEMDWLMVWGTTLLFIDSIAIILLYEKLGKWLRKALFLRLLACSSIVLTFDQVGFYTALYLVTGAPVSVLVGGWAAKMGAAIVYGLLTSLYLRWFERGSRQQRALRDIFQVLTYRERYEALLEHSSRDSLTGLLNRGSFDVLARSLAARCREEARPLSLLIVDVDHFKAVNDRLGHTAGDEVLRRIAGQLARSVRETDHVFRYGGEEFIALCAGIAQREAQALAERIRLAIRSGVSCGDYPITVSIGVASLPESASDLAELFACADARLYAAKRAGRDRTVGGRAAEPSIFARRLRRAQGSRAA